MSLAKKASPPLNPIDQAWQQARTERPRENLRDLEPGIYAGLSFLDYCNINAINRSSLSLVKQSLLHYRYQSAADETPSLRFGSLCHHGRLEPHQLASLYVVLPQFELDAANVTKAGEQTQSKATSYYKKRKEEFLALHPGKQEVSQEWINNMIGVVKSVEEHPIAGKWFSQGHPELTLVWKDPDTGLLCKARLDWLHTNNPAGSATLPVGVLKGKNRHHLIKEAETLVDLKTTQDCLGFYLDKYDYHLQAAMYSDGWEELTGQTLPFGFAVVESDRPHACRAAPAAPTAVMQGKHEYKFCLSRIASAQGKRGKWTGPLDPQWWDLSPWYRQDFKSWHPTADTK
jgi:exodeoxyribonuclease VIII